MRPRPRLRTIAGFLSLAGTLLLTSPGVKLVRAEDAGPPPAPATASGPSCRVDAPTASPEVAALIARLREQAAAQANSSREDFVVLNNRGYNYGPPPSLESGLLEAKRRSLQK
jgi:hypothetical protein